MVSVKIMAMASVLPIAYAQTQTLWGQCSGVTYEGPIICADGATCTVYNPYYGQCIPAPTTTTTPPPTKTTTTASCTSSVSTCTTTALLGACGTSTYCSTYCATAAPPRITVPVEALAKRCSPFTSTTGCRTTTSTCTTVALPIPCGTGLFTSTYCSSYCASTTAPPRITVPALALEKRCSPPVTTSV
ncbi:uncharacterized protein DFL_008372 [Arthrobotrys flagrans]|uniref:CBM1 domain-containing protein n=1 Tax=Arthrobotrys flagrans TaxID=97331 RepID=A0A436ZNM9_ARTFL|nr:hypothetical protein DFL_008372 [Arthrobotrys flagrans]